jgi:Rrf2 family protein
MILSLTCKIAVKAVIYLASKFESGQKAGIREIAEYIDANEHTVGKLLQTLVKDKVINSSKGPNGGFYITSRQMNMPILDIIDSIDGKDVFNQCGLGLSKCSSTHPCPIHNDYKGIRDQFKMMCHQKKIKDLCESVNEGLAHLIG